MARAYRTRLKRKKSKVVTKQSHDTRKNPMPVKVYKMEECER